MEIKYILIIVMFFVLILAFIILATLYIIDIIADNITDEQAEKFYECAGRLSKK